MSEGELKTCFHEVLCISQLRGDDRQYKCKSCGVIFDTNGCLLKSRPSQVADKEEWDVEEVFNAMTNAWLSSKGNDRNEQFLDIAKALTDKFKMPRVPTVEAIEEILIDKLRVDCFREGIDGIGESAQAILSLIEGEK